MGLTWCNWIEALAIGTGYGNTELAKGTLCGGKFEGATSWRIHVLGSSCSNVIKREVLENSGLSDSHGKGFLVPRSNRSLSIIF